MRQSGQHHEALPAQVSTCCSPASVLPDTAAVSRVLRACTLLKLSSAGFTALSMALCCLRTTCSMSAARAARLSLLAPLLLLLLPGGRSRSES